MKLQRQRSGWRVTALMGVSLVAVILGVAGILAPRIVSFSPSADAFLISGLSPIRIEFDQGMDPVSIQTRLLIQPEVPGRVFWDEDTLVFQPEEPWDRGVEVNVQLNPGGRSALFLPLLTRRLWTFQITEPRVLYLWPAGGPAEIYSRTLDKLVTERITTSEFGLIDYTLSLNGALLIYTEVRADLGTNLREVDLTSGEDRLLYACPEAVHCSAPSLSHDMSMLAFERRSMREESGGQQVPDPAHVWVFELGNDSGPRMIGPVDHETLRPTWSPAGTLGVYDATSQRILFLNHSEDFQVLGSVDNGLGVMGTWSRTGEAFVFPEIIFPDPAELESLSARVEVEFYSHLFQFNLASSALNDLSGKNAILVEDASPVYSPSGEWIAFGRKYLDDRWSLGRQLWLMRADGGGARALTDEPDFLHSGMVWNPDSTALLYLRVHPADLRDPSEIWLLQIESGDPEMLVTGGYMPTWAP